jgi:hypothetical protein
VRLQCVRSCFRRAVGRPLNRAHLFAYRSASASVRHDSRAYWTAFLLQNSSLQERTGQGYALLSTLDRSEGYWTAFPTSKSAFHCLSHVVGNPAREASTGRFAL